VRLPAALGLAAACAAIAFAAPEPLHAQPAAAETVAAGPRILVMLRLPPEHFRPNAGYGGAYGSQSGVKARRRIARGIASRNGLQFEEDGWPMPVIGVDCYVLRAPADEPMDSVIARVSTDPQVAWAQPMHVYETQADAARGGDPLFAAQPAAKAWRLAELHQVATGRGVRVAVVDSKIDVSHPDLAGQFIADQDFVNRGPTAPERHGTGVAGIIAAKAGNGIGIAGVAPRARLMALRACWQGASSAAALTLCDSLSLAKALQFAIEHRAGVINLSLTGPQDRLLSQLLDVAAQRRISVVAAFDPQAPKGGFPASHRGVLAVANQYLPTFPPGVYGAPGQDVPTTQPGGRWNLVNGSSYAAAHVSGLLALVREEDASAPAGRLVATQPTGGVVDACATVARTGRCCGCGRTARNGRPAG